MKRIFVLLACLISAGCGYHAAGHANLLPPDLRTLAVPAFVNQTQTYKIEQTLTAVATEQALDALAPDERRLIRLRYVHDLTQGQVAEVMGVPEGTVKVRLHRVRARLRVRAGELAA